MKFVMRIAECNIESPSLTQQGLECGGNHVLRRLFSSTEKAGSRVLFTELIQAQDSKPFPSVKLNECNPLAILNHF